jgi:glucose/arabinose dehydrogenase
MKHPQLSRHPRKLAAATGILALIGAAAAVAPAQVDAASSTGPDLAKHVVLQSGLDNPRQLQRLVDGDFLVAEAGHGSNDPDNCMGSGEDALCVGVTSKVTRVRHGHANRVMSGLLSGASPDGTFATGADGASHRANGPYYAIVTGGSPEQIPPGLPKHQAGRLLGKWPGGKLYVVANISAYERAHDPDGQGYDSNPYSVLALPDRVLVADAAGNDILSVNPSGNISLWAMLNHYGPTIDAVPTVVASGPHKKVYVGELHSEVPHKARVWQFDRAGNKERVWNGFTTVTGVARGGDGSLYVSELFGGTCGFDQIPDCFPGRVVKVAPDGTRTHVNVPFPAGIVTHLGRVYVNAFSVAPATGFAGNPAWSGQLWQIFI